VFALDRRGRGESGDTPAYSLANEAADIANFVNGLDQPVNLLAHSYGGLCSLEAALQTQNLNKFILYEPPLPLPGVSGPGQDPALIDRLEALVNEGNRAEMLLTFVREVLHMTPEAVEAYRNSPAWPGRLAAAHTMPREMRAQASYVFEPERFKSLTAPTLLLLGGASPAHVQAGTAALHSTLPHSRVVELPGQGHVAMDSAPDLFVSEVLKFLGEP
jgi:pimeloyl-ACP methyl ester carboxylesterase